MKRNKLDFLLNVTDNMRADVSEKSNVRAQEPENAADINSSATLSPPPSAPLPAPRKQKREEEKIITNSSILTNLNFQN
jgi:hypothetical protein